MVVHTLLETNGWSEQTQLQQWHINSSWKTRIPDLLFLITSGHSTGVIYTRLVTDWVNDVKWSIPAALTSWYCEGPEGDGVHWDISSKFISDLVEHEVFCLGFYYLICSLTYCIKNKHSSSVSRHRNSPIFPPPLYNAFQPQTLFFHYLWRPV